MKIDCVRFFFRVLYACGICARAKVFQCSIDVVRRSKSVATVAKANNPRPTNTCGSLNSVKAKAKSSAEAALAIRHRNHAAVSAAAASFLIKTMFRNPANIIARPEPINHSAPNENLLYAINVNPRCTIPNKTIKYAMIRCAVFNLSPVKLKVFHRVRVRLRAMLCACANKTSRWR